MDTSSSLRRRRPPGGSGDDERLQPAPELRIVGLKDLNEFEARREAERLARLAGDRELIECSLQWSGFEGPGWVTLGNALAEYGLSVLTAWISTGAIVRASATRSVCVASARCLTAAFSVTK